MEVTGPLREPNLAPCPTMNDVTNFKDGTCNPVHVKKEVDMSGWDCCKHYVTAPNTPGAWHNDVVRVDHVNPEKFQHDKFRYQMYAKPSRHDCHPDSGQQHQQQQRQLQQQRALQRYIPATTEVRALEQTMYIPVVPSNPGGETEVTFPMTSRTMGQPDVTSACCVPVIPSQPGFKNLTNGILQGPCCQLNGHRGYPKPTDNGGNCRNCSGARNFAPHCAPQTVKPLSNVPGGSFVGLPDTFPGVKHVDGSQVSMCSFGARMPDIPTLHPPHYTGALPSSYHQQQHCQQQQQQQQQQQRPQNQTVNSGRRGGCMDDSCFDRDALDYGMPGTTECVNTSIVRYDDRVRKTIQANQESFEDRILRLNQTYGAFGAYLIPNPTRKRFLTGPPSHLVEQGNGHHWSYPKHPNRQCYVLERTPRC